MGDIEVKEKYSQLLRFLEPIVPALESGDEELVLKNLATLYPNGEHPSYAQIACYYELGLAGSKPRFDLAYFWFRKGAHEQSDFRAFFGIARFYLYGKYVEKNDSHAMHWAKMAYEKGSIEAAIMLGYGYLHGVGAPQNLDAAIDHLNFAASQGFLLAYALLANAYRKKKMYAAFLLTYLKCIWQWHKLKKNEPNSEKMYFFDGTLK
jgi:TPR repeat protein